MYCKTTRTMLRAPQNIGGVFAVLLWKPQTKKANKKAGQQKQSTQQHCTPPKGNPRTSRRQTPRPAAARGTKATPKQPHRPKPKQKGFQENFTKN